MKIIDTLYNEGCVRDEFHKFTDPRYCSTDPVQLSTLLFLCPITSIFLGIGRLKDVWYRKHKEDTFIATTYFTITGILAALGLGCIISAMRIIIYSIALLAIIIGMCLDSILCESKITNILTKPLELAANLMPVEERTN